MRDYNREGSWLMRFSFKLLNPYGSVLEKINSKDFENKIENRYYSTYYFCDNERLIKAVISLVKEAREYLLKFR